jgi:hypothetical protein
VRSVDEKRENEVGSDIGETLKRVENTVANIERQTASE